MMTETQHNIGIGIVSTLMVFTALFVNLTDKQQEALIGSTLDQVVCKHVLQRDFC